MEISLLERRRFYLQPRCPPFRKRFESFSRRTTIPTVPSCLLLLEPSMFPLYRSQSISSYRIELSPDRPVRHRAVLISILLSYKSLTYYRMAHDTPPTTPLPIICHYCAAIFSVPSSAMKTVCEKCKKRIIIPPRDTEKWAYSDCCNVFVKMGKRSKTFFCPSCFQKRHLGWFFFSLFFKSLPFADGSALQREIYPHFPVYRSRSLSEILLTSETNSLLQSIQTGGVYQCINYGLFDRCEQLIRKKTASLKRKIVNAW